MKRSLPGKRILITGASRGIGSHLADRLGAAGCKLILTARDEAKLDSHVEALRGRGVDAHAVAADLTVEADRARLVEEAASVFGGLDGLVNNAAVASFGEFADSDEQVLRLIMETNFFAPVELIRHALPHLAKSANDPFIVNIASICGRRGIPSFPEHSAAKYALVGINEAMRAEFARFDVDVILVIPGMTQVDNIEKHHLRHDGKMHIEFDKVQSPETVAKGIARAIERGSIETVVGSTALWLYRGQRTFPWFIDWIMARKVRNFARANS